MAELAERQCRDRRGLRPLRENPQTRAGPASFFAPVSYADRGRGHGPHPRLWGGVADAGRCGAVLLRASGFTWPPCFPIGLSRHFGAFSAYSGRETGPSRRLISDAAGRGRADRPLHAPAQRDQSTRGALVEDSAPDVASEPGADIPRVRAAETVDVRSRLWMTNEPDHPSAREARERPRTISVGKRNSAQAAAEHDKACARMPRFAQTSVTTASICRGQICRIRLEVGPELRPKSRLRPWSACAPEIHLKSTAAEDSRAKVVRTGRRGGSSCLPKRSRAAGTGIMGMAPDGIAGKEQRQHRGDIATDAPPAREVPSMRRATRSPVPPGERIRRPDRNRPRNESRLRSGAGARRGPDPLFAAHIPWTGLSGTDEPPRREAKVRRVPRASSGARAPGPPGRAAPRRTAW